MLRSLKLGASGRWPVAGLLAGALCAHAAIIPDQVGAYHKTASKPLPAEDTALYQEYGFQEAERADFAAPAGRFQVTAWRFADSTGAMAFLQSIQGSAKASTLSHGNYVFQFTGGQPAQDDLEAFYLDLPNFETSPLPILPTYLPRQNLIAGSERYIVGPVSLDRFFPQISPSVAAFHLGTEAQAGRFDTPTGPLNLAIFDYPTPAIAMERYNEFQKIPGVLAKRAGPMVAVIVQPADSDAAERLLAQVRYNVNLTWNEYVGGPTVSDSAKMIMVIVALAGIIIAICLAAGIGFGAFRIVLRKMGWQGPETDKMIVLHLGDK